MREYAQEIGSVCCIKKCLLRKYLFPLGRISRFLRGWPDWGAGVRDVLTHKKCRLSHAKINMPAYVCGFCSFIGFQKRPKHLNCSSLSHRHATLPSAVNGKRNTNCPTMVISELKRSWFNAQSLRLKAHSHRASALAKRYRYAGPAYCRQCCCWDKVGTCAHYVPVAA